MTIRVVRPGVLSTIQDIGRTGYQHLGVPVAGAMDLWSHRVANALVGNGDGAATLEMTLQGPGLFFEHDHLIALCGADLAPRIGDEPVPTGCALWVRAGVQLDLGLRLTGCRAYLAVAGGFASPPVMGSRSTYLRGAFGGIEGRPLRRDDVLPVGRARHPAQVAAARRRLRGAVAVPLRQPGICVRTLRRAAVIRVTPGSQCGWFDDTGRARFTGTTYEVGQASDRMGYRLKGASPLHLPRPREMLSEGVAFGTVQVPPDGNPIVLMADRQTTGGYPKIANVASVDLPVLAQMIPGDRFHFSFIEPAESQRLLLAQEALLQQLRSAARALATTGAWHDDTP